MTPAGWIESLIPFNLGDGTLEVNAFPCYTLGTFADLG